VAPHRILAFDPTPAGLITGKSLSKSFKGVWARIRKQHFKMSGPQCGVCKVVEVKARQIDGHEIYSFSNAQIVRLERIIFICKRCHNAVHLERTRGRCEEDYVRSIEEHYCRVNGGLSMGDLNRDFAESQEQMIALREFYGGPSAAPDVDYGEYHGAVKQTLERRRQRSADLDDDDSDFEMFPDHECPWDVSHS
jgi:hypothetical protein